MLACKLQTIWDTFGGCCCPALQQIVPVLPQSGCAGIAGHTDQGCTQLLAAAIDLSSTNNNSQHQTLGTGNLCCAVIWHISALLR